MNNFMNKQVVLAISLALFAATAFVHAGKEKFERSKPHIDSPILPKQDQQTTKKAQTNPATAKNKKSQDIHIDKSLPRQEK